MVDVIKVTFKFAYVVKNALLGIVPLNDCTF